MSKIHETSDGVAQAISTIISDMMERIMDKVLQTDPFIPENHRAAKPLYAALVPDEIFKGSLLSVGLSRHLVVCGRSWRL